MFHTHKQMEPHNLQAKPGPAPPPTPPLNSEGSPFLESTAVLVSISFSLSSPRPPCPRAQTSEDCAKRRAGGCSFTLRFPAPGHARFGGGLWELCKDKGLLAQKGSVCLFHLLPGRSEGRGFFYYYYFMSFISLWSLPQWAKDEIIFGSPESWGPLSLVPRSNKLKM